MVEPWVLVHSGVLEEGVEGLEAPDFKQDFSPVIPLPDLNQFKLNPQILPNSLTRII